MTIDTLLLSHFELIKAYRFLLWLTHQDKTARDDGDYSLFAVLFNAQDLILESLDEKGVKTFTEAVLDSDGDPETELIFKSIDGMIEKMQQEMGLPTKS